MLIILVLAGCAQRYEQTGLILEMLKEVQGIKIDLPNTWEARKLEYVLQVGDTQPFRCDVNLKSPYPSERSSRTYLRVCTPMTKDSVLNIEAFAKGVQSDYEYASNVTEMRHGSNESFSHTDSSGREWGGFQYVSELHGINSISGGLFIQNAINVFVPLSGNRIIWLLYFVSVSADIKMTEPYSLGLSVFDSITIAE